MARRTEEVSSLLGAALELQKHKVYGGELTVRTFIHKNNHREYFRKYLF